MIHPMPSPHPHNRYKYDVSFSCALCSVIRFVSDSNHIKLLHWSLIFITNHYILYYFIYVLYIPMMLYMLPVSLFSILLWNIYTCIDSDWQDSSMCITCTSTTLFAYIVYASLDKYHNFSFCFVMLCTLFIRDW